MTEPRMHSAYLFFLVFNQTSNNFFETACSVIRKYLKAVFHSLISHKNEELFGPAMTKGEALSSGCPVSIIS